MKKERLLKPQASAALKQNLTERTGVVITDTASYIRAVCVLLDSFHAADCRFADHALDAGFFKNFKNNTEGADMLCRLGAEYAKRGWTLLLHIDAKRKTSARLAAVAGPAGGYAAVGGSFNIAALCDLLNTMEELEAMPDNGDLPPQYERQGAPCGAAGIVFPGRYRFQGTARPGLVVV